MTMTADDRNTPGEDVARVWRPSSSAAQRMQQQAELGSTSVFDASDTGGPLRTVLDFLARPFVRIVIGLALFISAALVYDEAVNYGSWTEKAEKAKATKHRGLAGPEKPKKMPD